MEVFELSKPKPLGWRHYNGGSLKTLKANYTLIRFLRAYLITKYVGIILL